MKEPVHIQRQMTRTALKLWKQYPILTVTGPRQSGKTTLVRDAFKSCAYVNLEEPDVRDEAMADARGFLARHPAPAIFDEIQNAPALVGYLQADVDRRGGVSHYVLTGSHQPALQAAVSESLAGRTGILQLLPLSIAELTKAGRAKTRDNWIFDGFMPRLCSSRLDPLRLYSDYFKTYVERDVRQLANLRNLHAFETFVRLLAGRIGQLLNLDSLASDVGVSASTVRDWLSLLEASYVIHVLRPYYKNFGKRFTKAPKVYFTEVGLACYLLGIREQAQVATHPLMGNLFENMVVMEMVKSRLNKGDETPLYFMRTSHGVEADVVVENDGKIDLVEIKAGQTFHDDMAQNLRSIRQLLPNEIGAASVVYAGRTASASDGIPFLRYDAVGELFCRARTP